MRPKARSHHSPFRIYYLYIFAYLCLFKLYAKEYKINEKSAFSYPGPASMGLCCAVLKALSLTIVCVGLFQLRPPLRGGRCGYPESPTWPNLGGYLKPYWGSLYTLELVNLSKKVDFGPG